MRVAGLLFCSILLGIAAIGAWIYFGPDGALPLVEGTAQPVERSKYRFAPYVVLVPAEPLPAKPAPSQSSAPGNRQSSEKTAPAPPPRTVTMKPEPAPVVSAAIEKPVSGPSSDVAKEALVAILGPDKLPAPEPVKITEPKAPEQPRKIAAPKLPPIKEPQPEPEVAAKAEVKAPPPSTPAPATQVSTSQRAAPKLKYEIETDRQAKAREEKKSLLSQGTIRFRRVVPVSPGRIKAGQNIVLLVGVNALGADTQCSYSTGTKWDCGKWGTFALRRFIRSRSVICDLVGEVSPSEVTGKCKVGGTDVSKWLVRRGWGTPTQETQDAYAADLDAAKSEKIGQWSVAPKSDS